MRRIWLITACTAVLATACLGFANVRDARAAAPTPEITHVTVVLAPYLTFEDLNAQNTPALLKLIDRGAVGAANVRARVRGVSGLPSPTESALAISAGAWSLPVIGAPSAFVRTETFDGTGTASAAYRRVFGVGMGNARIGFLGLPVTQAANDMESAGTVLGTLGQAVEDAGGFTAAVGNSDVGHDPSSVRYERPAAVAASDDSGTVHYGNVSAELLVDDPLAPYGRRTDLRRFRAELERVEQLAAAHRGPSLIVLDSGDLTRAQEFASVATSESAEVHRIEALRTLDAVVAMASEKQDDNEFLIVVSQALNIDAQGELEGLGPIVAAGGGWRGYLTSPSTHRTGIVTNLDVTATALDRLGIRRPVQVLGNAMVPVSGPASGIGRVAHLEKVNRVATSVDGAKAGVLNGYIGLAVVVLGLAGIVLARAHFWRPSSIMTATSVLMHIVLLLLSVPVASWLMFVVLPYPQSRTAAVLSLVGVALVVWAGALVLWRHFPPRIPVIVLTALTATVMLVEQLFGAPLSFVNFFGYSPLPAARFYGMGNESASVLFGASMAALALLLDEYADRSWAVPVRRFGIIALGVVVVFVAAAPFLGANVGVAIWGTVGFGLAWILMNGKQVTWKMLAIMGVSVVAVIGALAAIDLFGSAQQTHLARALDSAGQGGLEELWTIVVRKAETNARVFTRTNWSWVLIAVLGFLGFVRMRPTGDFADTLAENPRFADAITVTLAAGALAFFTEDSGIVIPALIMLYTGAGIVWLMLMRLRAATEDTA